MNARQAFLAAVAAHEGQNDKGGVPYIFHPLAVAQMVAALGEDFEVVALLHDVLEDTDYPLRGAGEVGIEKGLTPRQSLALDAITQRVGEQGKESYFDYIRRCREDFIARVVKVADLRHNLSPERSGTLPMKEAVGFRARYEKALEIIDGAEAGPPPAR